MSLISDLFGEKPIILFDSSPQGPPGFIWDTCNRFVRHLSVAWTGVPNFEVSSGMLRLFWVTTDGKEGKRDYELKEHDDARRGFEKLANLEEVARVMVLGYASQNPYAIYGEESEFEKLERKKKSMFDTQPYRDFVPKDKRKAASNMSDLLGDEIEKIIDFEDKKPASVKEVEKADV